MWCSILTGSKCITAVVRKPVFRFPNCSIEEVFTRVLSPTWRMDSALHFLLSFYQKEHCKQDPKVIRSFLWVSILDANPHEHTVLFIFYFFLSVVLVHRLAVTLLRSLCAHSEGLSERQKKALGSRHWDAELFPGLHITNGHHSSPCWTPKDLSLLLAGGDLMSLTWCCVHAQWGYDKMN